MKETDAREAGLVEFVGVSETEKRYARNTQGTQCVRADTFIECLFQVIVFSQPVVEFV